MKVCPACQFHNREGLYFCDDCGAPLFGDQEEVTITVPFTQKLNNNSAPPAVVQEIKNVTPVGTTVLKSTTVLVVKFKQAGQEVRLEPQTEIVFGRSDSTSQTYPDLDLTPYGALDCGVSRTHAAIRRKDNSLMLVDLNSTNGTFINGQQIPPEQPHIIRDGDEIQFGKLVANIYFKS